MPGHPPDGPPLHPCPVPCMQGGLERYYNHGVRPGRWLQALLSNSFVDTVRMADRQNLAALPHWADWLFDLDERAWGSPETVEAWIAAKAAERKEGG